jgi:hypothetical protein
MVEDVFPPMGWNLAAREWGNKRDRRRDAKEGNVFGVLILNPETGEAEVLLHPSFNRADWLTKADALSDVMGLLQRDYEKVLDVKSAACRGAEDGVA